MKNSVAKHKKNSEMLDEMERQHKIKIINKNSMVRKSLRHSLLGKSSLPQASTPQSGLPQLALSQAALPQPGLRRMALHIGSLPKIIEANDEKK